MQCLFLKKKHSFRQCVYFSLRVKSTIFFIQAKSECYIFTLMGHAVRWIFFYFFHVNLSPTHILIPNCICQTYTYKKEITKLVSLPCPFKLCFIHVLFECIFLTCLQVYYTSSVVLTGLGVLESPTSRKITRRKRFSEKSIPNY